LKHFPRRGKGKNGNDKRGRMMKSLKLVRGEKNGLIGTDHEQQKRRNSPLPESSIKYYSRYSPEWEGQKRKHFSVKGKTRSRRWKKTRCWVGGGGSANKINPQHVQKEKKCAAI